MLIIKTIIHIIITVILVTIALSLSVSTAVSFVQAKQWSLKVDKAPGSVCVCSGHCNRRWFKQKCIWGFDYKFTNYNVKQTKFKQCDSKLQGYFWNSTCYLFVCLYSWRNSSQIPMWKVPISPAWFDLRGSKIQDPHGDLTTISPTIISEQQNTWFLV